MTVENAEYVFGKRWNFWSESEQIEFVEDLTLKDTNTPLACKLIVKYWKNAPAELRLEFGPPGTVVE